MIRLCVGCWLVVVAACGSVPATEDVDGGEAVADADAVDRDADVVDRDADVVGLDAAGTVVLALEPETLTFAPLQVGQSSAPRTITIRNDGTITTSFLDFMPNGPAATDFDVDIDGCLVTMLAPGESCTIAVRFKPIATGERNALVGIYTLPITETSVFRDALMSGVGLAAPPSLRTLDVQITGQRPATVTGSGIDCLPTCGATYADGAPISLTANPGADTLFTRWVTSGPCNGSTSPTCTFTIGSNTTVTADFRADFLLTLVVGAAAGSVTVTGGSACATSSLDTTCRYHYGVAQNVTLSATADASACSRFIGWSGACAGSSSTCTVAMNQARNVRAGFDRIIGCTPA